MVKKRKSDEGRLPPPPPPPIEWDAASKEPWLVDFEKKAVNDDKWYCIVTAAIQAEAEDEENIQIFNEYAVKGLRKSIKTITMADVIEVLKGVENGTQAKRKDNKKPGKLGPEKKSVEAPPGKTREILKLAAKYAVYTDTECKLPPDLMAAILKCMILNIKEENISQKMMEAVKRRRIRNEKIKSDFIRSLKPYEERSVEREKDLRNGLEVIDDAPLSGPDLYIMLINFYDPSYFAHLLSVKVPFVAIFKITRSYMRPLSWSSGLRKSEPFGKKWTLIYDFWEQVSSANIPEFKDIAIIQYETPSLRRVDGKQKVEQLIFDELSWMLYIAYSIYREHQTYLRELYVQRVVLSLKPLNLSLCHVYNKLCDALVTGEPNTSYLVLYAVIEQVVAGVPDEETLPIAYDLKVSDFFPTASESDLRLDHQEIDRKAYKLVTPCQVCRDKEQPVDICHNLERFSGKLSALEISEWSDLSDGSTIHQNIIYGEGSAATLPSRFSNIIEDFERPISETLITQVLEEKKTEVEIRKENKWKGPKLCFYGDYIELETYHCDPRILDPTTIFDRLVKNSVLPRLWTNYPELPPEERAYFNYHFYKFWKISNQSEELLKLKMFFVLLMKLIGIAKSSYMYRGDEEISSDIFAERLRKLSKVRFGPDESRMKKFSSYFIKKLIAESFLRMPRKTIVNLENFERMRESLARGGSSVLDHVISLFNIQIHRDGNLAVSYNSKRPEDIFGSSFYANHAKDREFMMLLHILDCLDISSLTDFHIIGDQEEFLNLVQKFNFYEELEASRMIQRLLEAKSNYNTTQCSYFPPTDTMMIIMYNDSDYRGVFYNSFYSSLTTPVCLRDFFAYVYPEIGNWLLQHAKETAQVTSELQEKIKTAEEEADNEYLYNLKKKFCKMTEEERAVFLETGSTTLLQDQNLNDYVGKQNFKVLPFRFKKEVSNRISFIATNLNDVRVETRTEVHQYHSKDGTEVSVTQDSWLNQPSVLLTLCIKQSPLTFYLNQYLDETSAFFTLKTESDIRFSFFKGDNESSRTSQREIVNIFNYRVKISWPTGLLIQVKTIQYQDMYVKQSYIRSYREKWEISEEKCRCFLKSGQILIFKENGDVEILYGSGTKSGCLESLKSDSSGPKGKETSFSAIKKMASFQRYEITTPLGETWERVSKGPCKNKKRLLNTFKVYMGVDSQSQEIFYKRDDGVFSMLWPNGKLVTNFPDGTKITSIPVWDDEEIEIEWTEEEKRHFLEIEAKRHEELSNQQQKSKTILRKCNGNNSRTSKSTFEQKSLLSFQVESFVSVSCYYLMEHPKYATVVFDPQNPIAEIKMPKGLSFQMYPEGNYQVQQGTKVLNVRGTTVQFYSECPTCGDRSMSVINLDSNPVLCKFVDIWKKVFIVERNGSTEFQERDLSDDDDSGTDSDNNTSKCEHAENVAAKQRCFALQRDLTGIEFFHSDSLLSYCHALPTDTHFDLDSETQENSIKAHTFSSPYYKIGYENWVMKYEDDNDSLPTNLKKSDLRELGVKENTNKLFVYPFPRSKSYPESNNKQDLPGTRVEMPKVIVTRIVKCLGEEPQKMIDELKEFVAEYQRRAYDVSSQYKAHKAVMGLSKDEKDVKMKLLRISLTLNQGCHAYPHLCDILPSTETDIHKAGHYIDLMETFKTQDRDDAENWPDCKQIQRPMPRFSDLNSILEENEPF